MFQAVCHVDRLRSYLTVFLAMMVSVGLALLTNASSAQPDDSIPNEAPPNAIPATVSGYLDGDKFYVEVEGDVEEVNLISTDAPEPEECYATEASDQIGELLEIGQVVFLEFDKVERDSKDRLLVYVWVDREEGSTYLLNRRLLLNGYAIFKDDGDNAKYASELQEIEEVAQSRGRGLWGECGGGHVKITPEPKLGSADNPAPVGGTVSADGRDITLNNAYFLDSYSFLTPDAGNVFLVVDVTVMNTSESGKTHSYNELCFSAVDPDEGYKFDDTLLNPSSQPLGSGDLSVGDLARGEVVLEVRADSARIRVKYDTGCPFGGHNMYWIVVR